MPAIKYVVTETWPDPPVVRHVRTEHTELLPALLQMIGAVVGAIASGHCVDACWISDDDVALTSVTGRFLRRYTLTLEDDGEEQTRRDASENGV